MALADDMEIVKVILPKDYVRRIDLLIAPGQRSRSAVIRRMVEEALDIDFFVPKRSAETTIEASENHPEPADVSA